MMVLAGLIFSILVKKGIDNEYKMWDRDVFATAAADSGTSDNTGLTLRPRIADRIWQY